MARFPWNPFSPVSDGENRANRVARLPWQLDRLNQGGSTQPFAVSLSKEQRCGARIEQARPRMMEVMNRNCFVTLLSRWRRSIAHVRGRRNRAGVVMTWGRSRRLPDVGRPADDRGRRLHGVWVSHAGPSQCGSCRHPNAAMGLPCCGADYAGWLPRGNRRCRYVARCCRSLPAVRYVIVPAKCSSSMVIGSFVAGSGRTASPSVQRTMVEPDCSTSHQPSEKSG
jgi:hypothetical protein